MYVSVMVIALLTGLYTVITVICFQKVGGWDDMTATLQQTNSLDKLSMLRGSGDKSGMPWYAVFLGYPVLGIWYWCADQTIVQRVLGARSENDARVGSIFCGLIKVLPVFIFIVPGIMLYTGITQGRLEGVAQV